MIGSAVRRGQPQETGLMKRSKPVSVMNKLSILPNSYPTKKNEHKILDVQRGHNIRVLLSSTLISALKTHLKLP